MKYKANSDYIFECEAKCSGLNAEEVEAELKKTMTSLIKKNILKFACLSNDTKNTRDASLKLFSAIEAIQCVKGEKIIHIGRIPESWSIKLKKEMEEKDEMDKKRLEHLDDCIMIVTEGDNGSHALILDRRGLYTVSSSPPK